MHPAGLRRRLDAELVAQRGGQLAVGRRAPGPARRPPGTPASAAGARSRRTGRRRRQPWRGRPRSRPRPVRSAASAARCRAVRSRLRTSSRRASTQSASGSPTSAAPEPSSSSARPAADAATAGVPASSRRPASSTSRAASSTSTRAAPSRYPRRSPAMTSAPSWARSRLTSVATLRSGRSGGRAPQSASTSRFGRDDLTAPGGEQRQQPARLGAADHLLGSGRSARRRPRRETSLRAAGRRPSGERIHAGTPSSRCRGRLRWAARRTSAVCGSGRPAAATGSPRTSPDRCPIIASVAEGEGIATSVAGTTATLHRPAPLTTRCGGSRLRAVACRRTAQATRRSSRV